jgi:glycosyltransferase involved in cell wall biosynthesis
MPPLLRKLALALLNFVRGRPALHRPIHALAVKISGTRWGEQFIKTVIEPQYPTVRSYRSWVDAHDTLSDSDRAAIRAHVAQMAQPPLISVVMPAYATPGPWIRAAIESVRTQLYPHWQLCVADDASPSLALWDILREYAALDERIRVTRRDQNGHISAATNSALELATGEFVALMDHDDLLSERALYEVAAVIEHHPDADLIYSDEDKVDDEGLRFEPHFKTDWNPELMLSQNMVSHLGVYRRSLVSQVGGLRSAFDGSQDYDLALRVSELTTPDRIHHIPAVLYHWRQQSGVKSFSESDLARCSDAARRAVEEHLGRLGEPATVEVHEHLPGWLAVRRTPPPKRPMVSIIVPTRDRAELLAQCAEGILGRTAYEPFELLIVDNDSSAPETFALFDRLLTDPRVRVLPAPGPFNYPKLNNDAVAASRGEVLVLLNNDISMIDGQWLDALVAQVVRPNVGAVGARLLFPDGRVQHGGVALGIGGATPVAGHVGYGAARKDTGYYGHLVLPRNVSAVTAACLCLRREVFDEVGGMDEQHLAVAFNDVDLCLKIRARGYDVVWTPLAELYHHESATRGPDHDPVAAARFQREISVMRERWGSLLDNDPFYGPNFDRGHGDYRLASPPLRAPPWSDTAAAPPTIAPRRPAARRNS